MSPPSYRLVKKCLPCPFCGYKLIGQDIEEYEHSLKCMACFATGPDAPGFKLPFDSKKRRKMLRDYWNMRPEK